ncbi:YlbF family regulator [Desulfofalx alkaliphila]|uniref:YlbF family regulator n=1 Tax=Desulfofalx alkaliphila TaxID=105483 RepID=UPI00068CA12A|nr:YlbF family regulator [Desulfofalx alkaliphila]
MSTDTNTIINLAEKIGLALSETEEFKQKQEAEKMLRQDAEARKLIKEFQTLKNSYERMEKMGHPLSEKNMEQLKKAEEKAMANPNVKNWYDKTQRFYDLVIEVNKKIQEGITV